VTTPTGVADTTGQVPALDAGTYRFRCDVHPTMNGTFIVGSAARASGRAGRFAHGRQGGPGASRPALSVQTLYQ